MFSSAKQIWDAAVVHNRQALALVVADVLAMLQVFGGMEAVRLPRVVHAAIMRVLRPAESALRRLIVIAARDLVVEPPPHSKQAPTTGKRAPQRKPAARMSFQLIDPRKRFSSGTRVRYATLSPRVYVIAQAAPFAPLFQQPQGPPDRPAIPEDLERLISARRLVFRLKALTAALDDIPQQAKRLARWRLIRARQEPPRFSSPLRPGKPPGYRSKPQQEVDEILADCHKYALGVLSEVTPNTS
jgi:hypothetical protein